MQTLVYKCCLKQTVCQFNPKKTPKYAQFVSPRTTVYVRACASQESGVEVWSKKAQVRLFLAKADYTGSD